MRLFRRNPSGRAFAGPPACLDSLIWNNQTTLAQAKPEPPAKAPSRPRRVVQRFPRLVFPASYRKREKTFLKRHPEIRSRYYKTLLLLESNPHHPSLRLHALKGQLQGLHSVSISMQYRSTLELEIREREILFVDIGSHGRVYRS